jgi:hypothetical protein
MPLATVVNLASPWSLVTGWDPTQRTLSSKIRPAYLITIFSQIVKREKKVKIF